MQAIEADAARRAGGTRAASISVDLPARSARPARRLPSGHAEAAIA